MATWRICRKRLQQAIERRSIASPKLHVTAFGYTGGVKGCSAVTLHLSITMSAVIITSLVWRVLCCSRNVVSLLCGVNMSSILSSGVEDPTVISRISMGGCSSQLDINRNNPADPNHSAITRTVAETGLGMGLSVMCDGRRVVAHAPAACRVCCARYPQGSPPSDYEELILSTRPTSVRTP
jgi:hypothetical protein